MQGDRENMKTQRSIEDYADILDMPAHESNRHSRMSKEKRAAQFLPFSALTGFTEMIQNAGKQALQKNTNPEDADHGSEKK